MPLVLSHMLTIAFVLVMLITVLFGCVSTWSFLKSNYDDCDYNGSMAKMFGLLAVIIILIKIYIKVRYIR